MDSFFTTLKKLSRSIFVLGVAVFTATSLHAITVYVVNDLDNTGQWSDYFSVLITPFNPPNYLFGGGPLEQTLNPKSEFLVFNRPITDEFKYEITFRNTDARVIVQNTKIDSPWYRKFTDAIVRDPRALHLQFWTQTTDNRILSLLGSEKNPSTMFVSDAYLVSTILTKDIAQNQTIFISLRPAKSARQIITIKKEQEKATAGPTA